MHFSAIYIPVLLIGASGALALPAPIDVKLPWGVSGTHGMGLPSIDPTRKIKDLSRRVTEPVVNKSAVKLPSAQPAHRVKDAALNKAHSRPLVNHPVRRIDDAVLDNVAKPHVRTPAHHITEAITDKLSPKLKDHASERRASEKILPKPPIHATGKTHSKSPVGRTAKDSENMTQMDLTKVPAKVAESAKLPHE